MGVRSQNGVAAFPRKPMPERAARTFAGNTATKNTIRAIPAARLVNGSIRPTVRDSGARNDRRGTPAFTSGWRTLARALALSTLGGACIANALRRRRVHCYVTGPFFLLMASIALLYGLTVCLFSIISTTYLNPFYALTAPLTHARETFPDWAICALAFLALGVIATLLTFRNIRRRGEAG